MNFLSAGPGNNILESSIYACRHGGTRTSCIRVIFQLVTFLHFIADGDLAVMDVDEDYRVATDMTVED